MVRWAYYAFLSNSNTQESWCDGYDSHNPTLDRLAQRTLAITNMENPIVSASSSINE
jgi:hypothetical protein